MWPHLAVDTLRHGRLSDFFEFYVQKLYQRANGDSLNLACLKKEPEETWRNTVKKIVQIVVVTNMGFASMPAGMDTARPKAMAPRRPP